MVQITDTRNGANVMLNLEYVVAVLYINASLDIAEVYMLSAPFAFRVNYEDAAQVQAAVEMYNETRR